MEMVSSEQECVPVIISDEAEFPFQNVIDYSQISIKWPSTHIGPQLLDYLASIPGQFQAFASCFTFLLYSNIQLNCGPVLQMKISSG